MFLVSQNIFEICKITITEVKLVCDDKSDFISIDDDLIKSAGILYDTNRHLL